MAKPQGSKSTVPMTIDALTALLGGHTNIPVQVSKGWLESAKAIFGTGEAEPESEAGDDEDKGEKSSGVKIEE